MSKEFRTSVGGQALMEGIMMRGPEKICCAVRKPDGSIDLTYDTVTTRWYNKVPLVRGVCNMAENLYKGYKYLMHAADVAMEGETEPAESKLDKWFEEHATPAVQNAMMISIFSTGRRQSQSQQLQIPLPAPSDNSAYPWDPLPLHLR